MLHDPRPTGTPVSHVAEQRPDRLVISFKRGPRVGSTSDQLRVITRDRGSRINGYRWDSRVVPRDVGKGMSAASSFLQKEELHIFYRFTDLVDISQLCRERYVVAVVVFVSNLNPPCLCKLGECGAGGCDVAVHVEAVLRIVPKHLQPPLNHQRNCDTRVSSSLRYVVV